MKLLKWSAAFEFSLTGLKAGTLTTTPPLTTVEAWSGAVLISFETRKSQRVLAKRLE